jgi:hypothetical protein
VPGAAGRPVFSFSNKIKRRRVYKAEQVDRLIKESIQ